MQATRWCALPALTATIVRGPGAGRLPLLVLLGLSSACPFSKGSDPCATTTCVEPATCQIQQGAARCVCQTGYTGTGCAECDTRSGFHLDATGQHCTDAPCDPDPCSATNHERCISGICLCDRGAGYHLGADSATCTTDACDPDPCNTASHEACNEGMCGCAATYHRAADGVTCTTEPCDPDPCSAANHEVCLSTGCICEFGFHLAGDGATCTEDPCDPFPCDSGNHEVCNGGLCDCADGFHRGGNGVTCVSNLCDPDPCSAANHEVCVNGTCPCDEARGYHRGNNGVLCTTDPCNPSPCSGVDEVCTGGACDPFNADPCDPDLGVPLVEPDSARFFRDDLVVRTTGQGYALDFPFDLITGELILNMELDDQGASVAQRLAVDDFPICVPLDDSADGSGYAFVEDTDSSFSTTAAHTGSLAIVARDGEQLIGRFSFDALQNGGSAITQVRAGVFCLPPR